jgi:ArsR family transcriptional regulator
MSNRKKKENECCPGLKDLISVKLFKALGDPNRVTILSRLVECCCPSNVSEMAKCCPVDVSVVSRHLATLKEAGILHAEKKGKEVYYSIRAKELAEALRGIADLIESCGAAERKEDSDE